MYSNSQYRTRVIVGLIITTALLFFCTGVSIYQALLPMVTLKVDSVTIRQEDAMPEFKVYAEYSGDTSVVLDEQTGYTVQHLLEELNQGNGYQLNQSVDNTKEGTYHLELDFAEEIKRKFVFSWNKKINYRVESGTVTVLNKYGDWQDGQFQFLDGSYASGWINLGDDTYYFGEDGKYVTGARTISGSTYYFQKDGKFDTERNKVNPNRPMIALTFDDGPGLYTMQLLEQLEHYGARATFFMVGTRVTDYPDSVRKMAEVGCELGNHTTNHVKLTDHVTDSIIYQLNTTNSLIQNITGQPPTLVRPPYGAVNEEVQTLAGAPLILWSIDTLDWQSKDANLVSNYVLETVKDGDIVLMHDIYESTMQAAVNLIPQLIERGYQLVTISELAQARGITLEHGSKYYNFYR